eukprot:COSAG01_NODE_23094_length_828_cov_2.378601_1_plen_176_part_10
MNSVRLAGWAAKLQNVTTHTGDFKIEYSSGSSKAISSGADTLSRLLDSTAKTDSDDWNTVNYKDFPPIKMIYDQLDRDMDNRGRTLGAVINATENTDNLTTTPDILRESYIPDNIFDEFGHKMPGFDEVHPSLLSTSAALNATEERTVAAVQLEPPPSNHTNMVDRTKVIFQRPDG